MIRALLGLPAKPLPKLDAQAESLSELQAALDDERKKMGAARDKLVTQANGAFKGGLGHAGIKGIKL